MIYKAYLDKLQKISGELDQEFLCMCLLTHTKTKGCPHHKRVEAVYAVGVGVALEASSVSTSR